MSSDSCAKGGVGACEMTTLMQDPFAGADECESVGDMSEFTDIAGVRLPVPVQERHDFPYLVAGACFLTAVSGFINATAILTGGNGVTHATGSTTFFAVDTMKGNAPSMQYVGTVIASFLAGSITCSCLGGHDSEKFTMKQSNGMFLIVIGLLLTAGLAAEENMSDNLLGHSLLSYSNGMQNALCTSFSGAVIRTTHVTGMLTDIGISIGHYTHALIRGTLTTNPPPDTWKLFILVPQYLSFFLGAVTSVYFYSLMGIRSGYLASLPTTLLGMMYVFASTKGAFDSMVEEERAAQEMESLERKLSIAIQSVLQHETNPSGHQFILK
eukprot:TRINITY_DN2064_c0_g3_i1.p1 TRINITY_DN2064_c0_g3~~TRINITY_DN2064_c0_g3_i1.p1  ORF type:complete len:367 (+),score=117.61 TRINITY_DN2064_c0_g3_i1:126-1103(+)